VSPPSPLERRLFWLCIVLKVAFWAALGTMLVKGIWAAAAGREPPSSTRLLAIVAALLAAQLAAWLAWWLARRARSRKAGS
jgi:hypothetical protein